MSMNDLITGVVCSAPQKGRLAGLRRPFVVEACGALLWQDSNVPKRIERDRTSVVGGVRVDVVRGGKRQGCV